MGRRFKEGLEQSIKELDKQIKQVRREAKIAPTLEEKLALQKQQRQLESQRNKSRRELFDKQDEVDEKREQLIESLEGKLNKNQPRDPIYHWVDGSMMTINFNASIDFFSLGL